LRPYETCNVGEESNARGASCKGRSRHALRKQVFNLPFESAQLAIRETLREHRYGSGIHLAQKYSIVIAVRWRRLMGDGPFNGRKLVWACMLTRF
jgi:hypothetical protein